MKRKAWIVLLSLLCACVLTSAENAGRAGFGNIKNDRFWHTVDGAPIYSQGGGIFRFPSPKDGRLRYYWYGVRYMGAEDYLKDPSVTVKAFRFRSVTCYSSDDLVNWTFEGDVFTRDDITRAGSDPDGWVGRLGVAYVREIGRYALFVQHVSAASKNGESVLVVLGKSPAGRFEWHNWFTMRDMIGTPNTGDQTVFTDEDTGRSYLVYSYGRGRNKIYLSEIGVKDGKVGLLDCHQVFKGAGREGNCMFKYKGKYYMCASDLYGWDASHAYYLVADSIYGPYLPENRMLVMEGCSADYAHVTQTGFFVTVRGSKQETVVYCGDRWADFAGNGLGYNQWVPLSFHGETPFFNSLSSWDLNVSTGEWRVADDNDYVVNGSFEADRRPVPNPVKPRQDWLSGWKTEVLKGSPVSFDPQLSPRLNHLNTAEDRRQVTGEKSLCISDRVPFVRKVSQEISSTPYCTLPDGSYTVRLKVNVKGKFKALRLSVESGGRVSRKDMGRAAAGKWSDIVLEGVRVRGGKAVLSVYADGKAGATCLIDDVSMLRDMKEGR